MTTNPIQEALKEVEARIIEHEAGIREAEQAIKFHKAELEKWRVVVPQLAKLSNVAGREGLARKSMQAQVNNNGDKQTNLPKGFWRDWLTRQLSSGPMTQKDLVELAVKVVPNCDRNMVTCAIKRYETSKELYVDQDMVALTSYLEK